MRRALAACALLWATACGDPMLYAGTASNELPEEDAGSDQDGGDESDARASDARSPADPDREEPWELLRYLPKQCTSCPFVTSQDQCPFEVFPRTREEVERLGCFECACCDDHEMCAKRSPGLVCAPWVRGDRGDRRVGICLQRLPFGGGP